MKSNLLFEYLNLHS